MSNIALKIVCPVCRAAIGARCTEPTRDGSKFIATPHRDRLIFAKAPDIVIGPDPMPQVSGE